MDKLNKHDKKTVQNCINSHLEEKINSNYELLKANSIGTSKISPFLYKINKNIQKDIKNLEKAIDLNNNIKPD